MFESIDNKKNYQKIVEQIQNMILDGKMKSGDKLPPERELVGMLQVSRSSLREALKALEVMGLLESKQGEGSFIVNNVEETILKSVSIAYTLNGGSVKDVMQLRECLEVCAVKQIILYGKDEDIAKLEEIIEFMKAAESFEEGEWWDIKFHNKLIKTTNNILFEIIADSISDLMTNFISDIRKIYSEREAEEQKYFFIEQHKNIVAAIKKRDIDLAVYEVEEHLRLSNEDLIRLESLGKRP